MTAIGDLLANASSGELAHNTLIFETSLTGHPNNVETPEASNDPGLESQETGVRKMKTHHWLLIIGAVVAILIALWYFGGGSPAAA